MASIDIALPRRCMCGWKFSTRPAFFITWKFCDTLTELGAMSRARLPPVMPLNSASVWRNFGSSPFG